MILMYADEFGHDGVYDPADPNRRHHPLFGLAGFVLRAHRWRDLDRRYLRLKQAFYAREIQRQALATGLRAERFEPKDLQLNNRRDVRFTHHVFDALMNVQAVVFAYGLRKPVAAPHNSPALYGNTTQGLMRALEKFVRATAGHHERRAMLVIDRRQERRDVEVLASAQSYLFSAADVHGGFQRVIESPLLVRSEWHHGIQVADNICRVIGRVFAYRTDPAGQAAWQPFDTEFGHRIDGLTHHIAPKWQSVWVRA